MSHRSPSAFARHLLLAAVAIAWAAPASRASAQSTSTPVSHAVADTICARPVFRQFDYWVGDWTVKDTAGKVIGRNTVTRDVGGCALHEHWTSASGGYGESFTTYSPTEKKWHQLYIGSGGYILSMSGTFEDSRLVLMTGPHAGYANPNIQVVERWTWTPLDANRVRQTATLSRDGGTTWIKQFDGIYERQPVAGSR